MIYWVLTFASLETCFGELSQPEIIDASVHCAAVQFSVSGSEDVVSLHAFAKRSTDPLFLQWGLPLQVHPVEAGAESFDNDDVTKYRVLLRGLPPGVCFQLRLSTIPDVDAASPPSSEKCMRQNVRTPAAPRDLQVHRTDPRENPPQHDHSICIDLHWAHERPKLSTHPDDVYFRIQYNYMGESPQLFCEDAVGATARNCGMEIRHVGSDLPLARYTTVCGLRPKRRIRFSVEAFTCDGGSQATVLDVKSPPSAPAAVSKLVTNPPPQASIAGFEPLVILDWIPQHDDHIEGHAIYLGLRDVSAMKLMCWVPSGSGKYAQGHVEIPIVHKNHTFSEDAVLYRDYLRKYHVHQEQEIFLATRIAGKLESPAYSVRLGEWLVVDEALKCLTSFDADRPDYVMRPVALSWTQAEGMSLYD